MRKFIIILILMLSLLLISSCSIGGLRTEMLNRDNDDKNAEARLRQVIDAIKDKDKVALKSLFSKRALGEVENFDGSMDSLFEFIKGDVESWEESSGPTVYESNNAGHKKKEVNSYYYVNTNKQKYYFLLQDFPIHTDYPDNVGLYLLLVVKAEDREKVYSDDQKILYDGKKDIIRTGIYLPIK